MWCQEEPRNNGSWQHIYFRLKDIIEKEGLKIDLSYVGRTDRSSPATGSGGRHKIEQAELVQSCFKI